jgi:hypothetical protein
VYILLLLLLLLFLPSPHLSRLDGRADVCVYVQMCTSERQEQEGESFISRQRERERKGKRMREPLDSTTRM